MGAPRIYKNKSIPTHSDLIDAAAGILIYLIDSTKQ